MRSLRLVVFVLPLTLLLLPFVGGCAHHSVAPAAAVATPPSPTPEQAASATTNIRLFVPCGMIIPLRNAMDTFMKLHPDIKITGVFDNAVVLEERILKKHEPADVFVSPGATEIGQLIKAGLVSPAQEKAVGSFELVVIVPSTSKLNIHSPADLLRCSTISTPDPAVNSIGTSGKEALTNLHLWKKLRPRMVLIHHAIESSTLVAAGKSDAGICYRACPLQTNPAKLDKSKVRIAFSFPAKSYHQQKCLIAPLTNSAHPAAAKALVDFISSKAGRKILAAHGMSGCFAATTLAFKPGKGKSG